MVDKAFFRRVLLLYSVFYQNEFEISYKFNLRYVNPQK